MAFGVTLARLGHYLQRWRVSGIGRLMIGHERGNVLILTGLLLPVLLAILGLGFESASWYQTRRSMQNAADTAAVAAATNGTASYANEANAVTAQYGFLN